MGSAQSCQNVHGSCTLGETCSSTPFACARALKRVLAGPDGHSVTASVGQKLHTCIKTEASRAAFVFRGRDENVGQLHLACAWHANKKWTLYLNVVNGHLALREGNGFHLEDTLTWAWAGDPEFRNTYLHELLGIEAYWFGKITKSALHVQQFLESRGQRGTRPALLAYHGELGRQWPEYTLSVITVKKSRVLAYALNAPVTGERSSEGAGLKDLLAMAALLFDFVEPGTPIPVFPPVGDAMKAVKHADHPFNNFLSETGWWCPALEEMYCIAGGRAILRNGKWTCWLQQLSDSDEEYARAVDRSARSVDRSTSGSRVPGGR